MRLFETKSDSGSKPAKVRAKQRSGAGTYFDASPDPDPTIYTDVVPEN